MLSSSSMMRPRFAGATMIWTDRGAPASGQYQRPAVRTLEEKTAHVLAQAESARGCPAAVVYLKSAAAWFVLTGQELLAYHDCYRRRQRADDAETAQALSQAFDSQMLDVAEIYRIDPVTGE